MKNITVFDFDGTLTRKDSMMAIIIFKCGRIGLMWALLRQIHLVVLMFLGLYSNQKTKERLLAYCFGGMTETEFDDLCQRFVDSHRHIMRPDVLQKYREAEHPIVISASPHRWVSKFVDGEVLSSNMEVVDGRITGRLIGKNCYGEEKVNRLVEAYPDIRLHRADYHITAYGDSRGDREMLAFADKGVMVGRK